MIFSLLLAHQLSITITGVPQTTITPAMVAILDHLMDLPVLATNRAFYRSVAPEDRRVSKGGGGLQVSIPDNQYLGRGFHVLLDATGTRFFEFALDDGLARRAAPLMPRAEAEQFLKDAIAQLDSGVERPNVWFRQDNSEELSIHARRVAYGHPLADTSYAAVNLVTHALTRFSRPEYVIDPTPFGNDPTLSPERLREIGYGEYMKMGAFTEAEIDTDEVQIDLLGGSPDQRRQFPEKFSAVQALERPGIPTVHVGIPTYLMVWRSTGGSVIEVQMDARDGMVFHSRRLVAMGGVVASQSAAPFPNRVAAHGVSGDLAPLDMRSFTPPGRAVAVEFGKRVLLGQFEPGQGTLWLRRDTKEPYRAFRPDAALLAAMRAQKPFMSLGSKPPRPKGG